MLERLKSIDYIVLGQFDFYGFSHRSCSDLGSFLAGIY